MMNTARACGSCRPAARAGEEGGGDAVTFLARTKPLRGSPVSAQFLLQSTNDAPFFVSLCLPSPPCLAIPQ